jgi:osmotically-inducible protein OsmY
MKMLSTISFLALVGFMAGCSRSDTDRTATDARDSTISATRNTAEIATNVTPTSRNIDATNRTYSEKAAATEPDNTGKNVRDRSDAALTPGDQGNSEADREITRNIRRAITKNSELSTIAKNIKIITVNGQVTLRGPVNTEQEQQAIATATQGIPGVTGLDNQLEVKAK